MTKILFLLFITVFSLNAQLYVYDIKPKSLKSDKFMSIKILDSLVLKFDDVDGIEFSEISALAYKKKILYALSDKGNLFHFKINIKKNTIGSVRLLKALHLRHKDSKRLKKKHRDSEGMVLIDDRLYISFERKPRVDIFSLNGEKIKEQEISQELKNIHNYQTKNKALEAIAHNEKYGIITAPELPLRYEYEDIHVLYAKDKKYAFRASSALSAMEFIDDNRLLTLERAFNKITGQITVTLKEVNLKKIDKGICRTRLLADMNSSDGWRLDNFEGLVKVGKNRFLMISDDNGSSLQKTVLVLFEVLKD